MACVKQRVLNLLVAVDQLLYVVLTLGRGYPDETMSSAAYRADRAGRIFGRIFRPSIDAIFFTLTVGRERNHCENSYLAERSRAHFPQSMRSE